MSILDRDSNPRQEAADAYNASGKPKEILAAWSRIKGQTEDDDQDIIEFALAMRRQAAALLSDAITAIPANVVQGGVFYGSFHTRDFIAGLEAATDVLDQAAGRGSESD